MKINNPDMEKVRKVANAHEKEQNSFKSTSSTSKAFQIKSNNTKTLACYANGETGHKSIDCKKNKDSLKCTKCKRTGHEAKICRSKPDSRTNAQKKSYKARVATADRAGEGKDKPAIHEARGLRSDLGTPTLLL